MADSGVANFKIFSDKTTTEHRILPISLISYLWHSEIKLQQQPNNGERLI